MVELLGPEKFLSRHQPAIGKREDDGLLNTLNKKKISLLSLTENPNLHEDDLFVSHLVTSLFTTYPVFGSSGEFKVVPYIRHALRANNPKRVATRFYSKPHARPLSVTFNSFLMIII